MRPNRTCDRFLSHSKYDTVTPPHDGSIRRISFPVAHAGSVRYLLQLETPLRLVDDTLRLLLLLLAALAGAMLVAGWIGSRWLAREAEIKCDEWIAAKPAGDPEGAQRLAFELSCRCAHRREKVRKVFENFIQANPEHRGAKAEFEQFSRAMTEKIDAVLEFERLRVEDRVDGGAVVVAALGQAADARAARGGGGAGGGHGLLSLR